MADLMALLLACEDVRERVRDALDEMHVPPDSATKADALHDALERLESAHHFIQEAMNQA